MSSRNCGGRARTVLSYTGLRRFPAEQVFVSAFTVGEIQAGIETTDDQDPAKAQELELWLDQVVDSFGVLPMDSAAFRT